MTLDELLKEIKTDEEAEKYGIQSMDLLTLQCINAELKRKRVSGTYGWRTWIIRFIVNYCDDLMASLEPTGVYKIKYKKDVSKHDLDFFESQTRDGLLF